MAGKDGRDRRLEREPVRRKPYGRRPTSARLITDPDVIEYPASSMFVGNVQKRPLAMPQRRGGIRWLVRCPRCQAWRQALYAFAESWCGPDAFGPWCRYCLKLGKPSAYTRKRAEADEDRIRELERLAFHDRRCTPETRQRRWERLRAARLTFAEREEAHYERLNEYRARDLARLVAGFGSSPDECAIIPLEASKQ